MLHLSFELKDTFFSSGSNTEIPSLKRKIHFPQGNQRSKNALGSMIPEFYFQNLDLNNKPDECHRALSLSSCSWAFITFASIFFARLEVADLEHLTISRVSLLNTSATYLNVILIVIHNTLFLYLGMSPMKRKAIQQRSEMCRPESNKSLFKSLILPFIPFLTTLVSSSIKWGEW